MAALPKSMGVSFLVLAGVLLMAGARSGMSLDESDATAKEYALYADRVKSLRTSRNLDEVEKLAAEIEAEWVEKSKERYAALMLKVCLALNGEDFEDDKQYDLEHRYALLALEKNDPAGPDAFRAKTETRLILIVFHANSMLYSKDMITRDEYSKRRSAAAKLLFQAWKRQQDQIDPDWDPNHGLPAINLSPPAATGMPSGIAPEAIKDPELRAQYEAAIDKNRKKAQAYRKQSRLRKLKKLFWPIAERHVIRAYSKEPFNTEELKAYLREYVADKEMQARILGGVAKATQEAAGPAGR